jgi:antitoxin HicB
MNEETIGSNFDDFLTEEGLLEEAEAVAIKRVLAFQVKELMEAQNLSKAEMARRMKTSRAALERLLDPENRSVTLNTMDKAARSLGKRLQLVLS